ncbi:unnamed protein product [Brassica oleracea var. botrytis]|uniref:(rape) hypothetical protein n=1 Tax=Brassica napus TaxID=3708 RepID=A0A816K3A3_BRANA|nr:unnamed protein product [Brassica napus]
MVVTSVYSVLLLEMCIRRSVVGCFCIIVWDMGMAPKENAIPLAETNTKSRLAGLAGSALKSMRKAHIGNQKAQKLEEVPNSGRALLLID